VALVPASRGADAPGFELTGGSVAPRSAFYDGVDPVTVRLRFTADGPSDLSVRIRRGGRLVRRLFVRDAEPGFHRIEAWDGARPSGKAAKEGGYRAFVKPVGGPASPLGRFRLHNHIFPVRGKHGVRGWMGEFGAPRSEGRTHEGFDVVAACGRRLVAARGGRVVRRGFDPRLYGNYVLIKGRKTPRNYFYSHLAKPAEVGLKERVFTGQALGKVGKTGNARTIGCHLHFEIRKHGRPIDPEPELRRWDAYS
jgi:murein DD-endopeptidase MepM/ murein hydrolase activator NlpD